MALFKIYKGKAEFLPQSKHEGYAYFTTDEGNLYIDIDDTTRVQVNALAAQKLIHVIQNEESEDVVVEIQPDEILTTNDIIPVENGGTGNSNGIAPKATQLETIRNIKINLASSEPAEFNGSEDVKPGVEGILSIVHGGTGGASVERARQNLEVYSKTEIDMVVSKATTTAYTVTLSTGNWVQENDLYKYDYSNSFLTCGTNGTTPPLIAPTGTNIDEYSLIESAEATPNSGIVFTTSIQPTADIDIVVIDMK